MLQLAQRTDAPSSTSVFDENRRLNGHVERAGDAHALERLQRAVFFIGWPSGQAFRARKPGWSCVPTRRAERVANFEVGFGSTVALILATLARGGESLMVAMSG